MIQINTEEGRELNLSSGSSRKAKEAEALDLGFRHLKVILRSGPRSWILGIDVGAMRESCFSRYLVMKAKKVLRQNLERHVKPWEGFLI